MKRVPVSVPPVEAPIALSRAGGRQPSSTFLTSIQQACSSLAATAAGWSVQPEEDLSTGWILVHHRGASMPEQGWKLHVSATWSSAEEVLGRALTVLLADNADFKVAGSRAMLEALNQGEKGPSQVGKFITVYPNTDNQAVDLAVALDEATRGLRGPAVPSDRPLAPGSLVYYRFGGFKSNYLQTSIGEIVPALATPEGVLVPDRRLPFYHTPDWASDPFLAAGVASELHAPNRLIGDHYLLLATLYQSVRGTIYLALDLTHGRRCVLKRSYRDTITGPNGQDASKRTRHEAEALALLAPDPRVPAAYELFEHDGDLYLAMEDVEGETLEKYVMNLALQGRFVPVERVVRWGKDLASLLGTFHAKGVVYRDLKSTNVLVAPDGQLRLIDYELLQELASTAPLYGLGTPGYMSPQQARGEPAAITDEIYNLGALLYYLVTGAEPSQAPHGYALLDRPLLLLNPGVAPGVAHIICRCLDPNPQQRFPSMAALAEALAAPGLEVTGSVPPFGGELVLEPEVESRRRYRALARRLGATLCQKAVHAPEGKGRFWLSTHEYSAGLPARTINSGSAGAVLALAELVAEFSDPEQRSVLQEGALWLTSAPRPGGFPVPGLYIGEAGIGAALLRAGQVLGDAELIATAARQGRWIATLPYGSPDLFNGTAGRLRFHLLLWDETGESEHLQAALEAGEALLTAAESLDNDELRWTFPPGYEGLSGNVYLGYAHGVAGIADALLDLFEASDDKRFFTAARRAGKWLARQALPVLDDGSGLDWPALEGGDTIRGGLWCHGATGIGRFLLHAAQQNVLDEAAGYAARAARRVARGSRWAGPVQCHGLAGTIEVLLDMYQGTGDQAYLVEARSQGRLLEAFLVEREGLLVCSSETPTMITPDYMIGYAGVAVCLLRLSAPERLPHQLSRCGFRHRPQPAMPG